ncbi:hypothetical protein CEXT_357981 [Caerostris extrusa]|uniref:Maturase K n=1 Tax=Caerostris extrusa TaxID=172846 RepID=A0AAV4XWV5_CAEEX|nr:hypothetical protein CEXT_357981 [Caerostris extrusa]
MKGGPPSRREATRHRNLIAFSKDVRQTLPRRIKARKSINSASNSPPVAHKDFLGAKKNILRLLRLLKNFFRKFSAHYKGGPPSKREATRHQNLIAFFGRLFGRHFLAELKRGNPLPLRQTVARWRIRFSWYQENILSLLRFLIKVTIIIGKNYKLHNLSPLIPILEC